MTTATLPPTLPRDDDRFRPRPRQHRWTAPAAVRPEIVTVLVLTVAGEVDDDWLAELTRGSTTATVQRLTSTAGQQGRAGGGEVLVVGDVHLDLGRFEVTVAGRRVDLSHQELLLLQAFLQHPGQLLSRERLLAEAWGQVASSSQRTVDVHVRRLRVKLGASAARLVTVRGFGYRFEE